MAYCKIASDTLLELLSPDGEIASVKFENSSVFILSTFFITLRTLLIFSCEAFTFYYSSISFLASYFILLINPLILFSFSFYSFSRRSLKSFCLFCIMLTFADETLVSLPDFPSVFFLWGYFVTFFSLTVALWSYGSFLNWSSWFV